MATREEILLGFQVISKVNIGSDVTHNSAHYMRLEEPDTGEPLMIPSDEEGNPAQPPTVEFVKTLTENESKAVDIEVETRLKKFIENFNDNQAINRGLQHFSTERQHVDRDVEEVLTHTPNIRIVNQLIDGFKGLKTNGDLLSLYQETVDLYVQAEQHFELKHRALTAYQDVLNAISIELQGLCSYSGELHYPNFQERVDLIKSRLRVATLLRRPLSNTQETIGFFKAHKQVHLDLQDAKTVDDLSALGVYLETKVPQLPLLRRWWKFN